MEKNYGEIVCTAIDEIVSTRLQGLQYDITKQCIVKDDSRAHQGRYVVSDGGAKFEAFSSDTSFKNGNSVLVTIPNGDFTMQKMIVGRLASIDTTPFKYISPLDSMIKIENGMLENLDIPEIGLLANRNNAGSIIECFTVPRDIAGDSLFKGYTRLGIQADFKSLLNGMDVVEGSYGIKILIYADKPSAPGEIDAEGVWELTLSSEDMIGNPYQFSTYFQQEKVFDISDISNIKEIKVYFYQNGNFKDISGDIIPYLYQTYIPTSLDEQIYESTKDRFRYFYFSKNEYIEITEWPSGGFHYNTRFAYLEENNLPNNLYVSNFKFYFGYELERYQGETLELYPQDTSLGFHHSKSPELKRIGLRWIHQTADGTIRLMEPQDLIDDPTFEIRWFRYNFGYPLIDEYAKMNWERIAECKDYIRVQEPLSHINFEPGKYVYLKNNQYVDLNSWDDYDEEMIIFEVNSFVPELNFIFSPNINLQNEKIKAIGLIKKDNGIELDKEQIEMNGGDFVLFADIESLWEEYLKQYPYSTLQHYIKQEDEYVENDSGEYVKLDYVQITGLQALITSENKTSTDYLTELDNFIQLFTLTKPAYLIESYSSLELVFTNEEKVVDQTTYDAATALSIVCSDGSEGNYLIYDQNGMIKNAGQGQGYERNFQLALKKETIDLSFADLDRINWVQWYLPNDWFDVEHTSTMLSLPNIQQYTDRLLLDGVDYVMFKYEKEYVPVLNRYPGNTFTKEIFMKGTYYVQREDDISKYDVVKEWDQHNIHKYYEYRFNHFMQPYSIKNEWRESATNNTIRVALSIGGTTYEALEELKFGKGGTSGTNATFLLEFADNSNALIMDQVSWLKVKGRFYEGHTEVSLADLPANWLNWKNLKNDEIFLNIHYYKTDINNEPVYESGKKTLFIESNGKKIALPPVSSVGVVNTRDAEEKYFIRVYENIELEDLIETFNPEISEYFYQDNNQWIKFTELNESFTADMKFALATYTEKLFNSLQPDEEFIKYIDYNPSVRYIKFEYDNAKNDEWYFKNNFHILEGLYLYNNIKLYAYLPVPLKQKEISHIEGTKEVSYNSQGKASYYASPYKVFKYENYQYNEITNDELQWNILNTETVKDDKAKAYLPSLVTVNGKKAFSPSMFYAEGAENKVCVYCNDNENYYWSQPVLIYKHRYDFDILNSWNGGLQTDEQNGTIMASMLGAGRKNEDNTFSGVLIGDIKKGTANTSSPDETGLYGLYKGDVSFALKDDGTATFGVAGKGQIHIDGFESTITSANYKQNQGGMKIDLDDGIIEIQESSEQNAALRMKSHQGTMLINIDNKSQFLRSNNYYSNESGMEIDLSKGLINISGQDGQIIISEDAPYLLIKGNIRQGSKLYTKINGQIKECSFLDAYDKTLSYYTDINCTIPISFQNNQDYKSYLYNLSTLMEVGSSNGFYLKSMSFQGDGDLIKNTSGQDVYEKVANNNQKTYHSKDAGDGKWYTNHYNTNTSAYIKSDTTSFNYVVANDDFDFVTECDDWKKENPDKTLTKDQKDQIRAVVLEARLLEFENSISALYSNFGQGLKLDLQNGKIEGYNLFLRAVQQGSKTNTLLINSGDNTYPLQIGSSYKVNWNGDLKCRSLHFGKSDQHKSSVLCVNNNFYVNSNGKGYISNAGYASSAGTANKLENSARQAIITDARSDRVSKDTYNKLVQTLVNTKVLSSGMGLYA